jgi:hypothetical protein
MTFVDDIGDSSSISRLVFDVSRCDSLTQSPFARCLSTRSIRWVQRRQVLDYLPATPHRRRRRSNRYKVVGPVIPALNVTGYQYPQRSFNARFGSHARVRQAMADPVLQDQWVLSDVSATGKDFLPPSHTAARRRQVTVRLGMESGHLPRGGHHFFPLLCLCRAIRVGIVPTHARSNTGTLLLLYIRLAVLALTIVVVSHRVGNAMSIHSVGKNFDTTCMALALVG